MLDDRDLKEIMIYWEREVCKWIIIIYCHKCSNRNIPWILWEHKGGISMEGMDASIPQGNIPQLNFNNEGVT